MKNKIAKRNVIRLVVKYEKRVYDNCVNQTSGNSSGDITEHWKIRSPSKQSSIFTKPLESVESMMSCSSKDCVVGHQKLMAICSLTPASTKSTEPTCYSSLCNFFLYRLANLGVKLDNIDCSTQTTDNFQPSIKITKSTGNNTCSSTFEGLLQCSGWAEDVLSWLGYVFVLVFHFYSPTFFGLFSPTEVTEDGVHHIVLDGASPVSLQSLMGNYFFSKEDTMWHRARKFIIRVVVLPFPFLGLAMFGEYLQQSKEFLIFERFAGVSHLFQSGIIAYCVCYVILAFYESFCISRSREGNLHCFVCLNVKSKTICRRNLPKNIINHLRIQPQIIVHYWGLFMRYFLNYFKTCVLSIPSVFKLSAIFLLRWFLFIVLLFFSPAIIIILLMFTLIEILYSLMLTSPLFVLCDIARRLRFTQLRDLCLILFSIPAFLAINQVSLFAGASMFIAFLSAIVLLLSEPESFLYVAGFVLVLYYIWRSYSSFTNKYRDLALALLKQVKSYKTSRPVGHSQVTDMSLETDSLLQNTQTTVGTKDNVLKIPQKLFYMACEELMPLRESVCKLILKITLWVFLAILVFSVTVLLNVGLTPIMKTLIAFLTGLFPKIVEICRDGGNQKKIEAMIAEEKIPKIVQEYMEGTSAANQQQLNRGSVVDV